MTSAVVNPIIPGYAPDPSIVLIDDTFFLVNSTFHIFPGLPIYASKDLLSWQHVGNAINRRSQLSLKFSDTYLSPPFANGDVMLCTGGLYAPTIRHHGGTTYIVCTNIIHSETSSKDISENFIVFTNNILSDDWSDPIYFQFEGIDPSLFFDDDGRSYIQASAAPGPMTKIHLFEIDLRTGKKLSAEKKIWDGTGGIYPEGPHIYKKDDWYYLLISEGGTHADHMITAARSKGIWGPYEAYENNPILTARGTDEYIQYTGHCDVFQDRSGQWWGVCLGVRKTKGNSFIMGRETFLTSGSWAKGEWPSLDRVKLNPQNLARTSGTSLLTAKPGVDYLYIRDADLSRYQFSEDGGTITLKASNIDLSNPTESPTFIGKRQRVLDGSSTVTIKDLNASPRQGYVKAGLAIYKDEHRYIRVFYDTLESTIVFEKRNNAKKIHSEVRHRIEPLNTIELRIEYTEEKYDLSYKSTDQWQQLGSLETLEMTDPDFVGPVVGAFAVAHEFQVDVRFSDLRIG